jgi:hypothetical protein
MIHYINHKFSSSRLPVVYNAYIDIYRGYTTCSRMMFRPDKCEVSVLPAKNVMNTNYPIATNTVACTIYVTVSLILSIKANGKLKIGWNILQPSVFGCTQ